MILFVYLQPKLIPILGNQQLPSLSLFPVDHPPSLKLLDFMLRYKTWVIGWLKLIMIYFN